MGGLSAQPRHISIRILDVGSGFVCHCFVLRSPLPKRLTRARSEAAHSTPVAIVAPRGPGRYWVVNAEAWWPSVTKKLFALVGGRAQNSDAGKPSPSCFMAD